MYDLEDATPGTDTASSKSGNAQATGSARPTLYKRQTSLRKVGSSSKSSGNVGQWCPRISVLLLAMAAAVACTMAAMHVHKSSTDADLRDQIQQLRAENKALADRAALAQSERQDLAQIILDPNAKSRLFSMMQRSKAFDQSIRNSGFKSRFNNTYSVRECLGRLLFELNISSILDVPCGPASWQPFIPGIGNVTYVGGDISLAALETAKHRPEAQAMGMDFMLFDPVHFPLKRAFDLVLFKDAVEQHRVQDTLTALLNFKSSGSRYLAATYWPGSPVEANSAAFNLPNAGWYEANLLAEPFNFPAPLMSCENADGGSKYRGQSRLGIWKLTSLPVTAADVQAAAPDPEELRRQVRQKRREPNQLPREVHILPPSRFAPEHGKQSLGELLDDFGAAFAPSRRSWHKSQVEEIKSPFDGLINKFLETPGPVKQVHHRRPSGLSDFFRVPQFNPRDFMKSGPREVFANHPFFADEG